jgi:hypothetical protein
MTFDYGWMEDGRMFEILSVLKNTFNAKVTYKLSDNFLSFFTHLSLIDISFISQN